MDQLSISSELRALTYIENLILCPIGGNLVLHTLLHNNRPPTDQEKAIIYESMAPTNAKLQVVEAQISDVMAHIQGLKLQVSQAEIKLQRLLKEKAAILETATDHRRVLSAVRNLPEDVLRKILVSCIEGETSPVLSYLTLPLPYILAQISSGIRRIALATPIIWASMAVLLNPFYVGYSGEQVYSSLARRVRDWFERARGLPLTVYMQVPSNFEYANLEQGDSDPSQILFDALFSYSSRWKNIEFNSNCEDLSAPVLRFAALTPADVPLLESITLYFRCLLPSSVLSSAAVLKTPALRHISLDTDDVRKFFINWATLTTIWLGGKYSFSHSKNEIAGIFQQTKCLVSCDIIVGPPRLGEEIALDKIKLPFLEILHINEKVYGLGLTASTEGSTLLDHIAAPNLAEFHIHGTFLEVSLLNFFKRSPNICDLKLPYLRDDHSFTLTTTLLRHCSSLTTLFLYPCHWDPSRRPPIWDANTFMRSFIEGEDNVDVTCPRLQFVRFTGQINFSLDTLKLFLEGKQALFSTVNKALWKKVVIEVQGINATKTQQQILDLILQKKAEGLDVEC